MILFLDHNEDAKREFLNMIQELIYKALTEYKNESSDEMRLYTREKTAEILSIDLSTLHSWVNKGYLDCYSIGARRYFKEEDILAALKKV